ncbi:carboxymuconolactone decarboxylase family protein [Asanoa sp. WMMD1127]|nr:carboxymuconolactone decarboxylase family protein [Asanoa sp. WMMD1127]MDG4820820.1 carboxymuconolactone decarboxylase family protein [Asanoa sp. WMMD1127]
MANPAFVVPDAIAALQSLGKATSAGGVAPRTLELVHLRASQINGCSVCVHMHARDLRKAGDSEERIATVAAWRDTPYFTDAERAALALTEAVTRLADRADAVPDEIWDEAARHFGEQELASLVMSIAVVNLWNRLNLATAQVAGQIPG